MTRAFRGGRPSLIVVSVVAAWLAMTPASQAQAPREIKDVVFATVDGKGVVVPWKSGVATAVSVVGSVVVFTLPFVLPRQGFIVNTISDFAIIAIIWPTCSVARGVAVGGRQPSSVTSSR